jgi:O-succinylbenzoic acid--CoA ligase
LLDGARAEAATHVSLVPTQLHRWLEQGAFAATAHLSTVLLGGAPLPLSLRERAAAARVPLVASYGMTETCGAISAGRDRVREANYAGTALPGWQLRVEDDELLIRGPGLCLATATDDGTIAPIADEWYATGDLAHLDADGSLFVLGRQNNVIITGGEKLPAEELEAALLEVPGITEAVVVPIEDPEWGQRPVAFVRFEAGQARDLAALRAELADMLASWKLPVALRELPPTAGLKPDRAALMRLAADHRP